VKIVSWNCNGKFRDKFDKIALFDADIYVIQECENPKQSNNNNYISFSNNYLWYGENKNKGLGIFAKRHIKIVDNKWESYGLKSYISCKVNNSFNLLAVWACKPYIEGYLTYQTQNLNLFDSNMIIIGDFNSNAIWDNNCKNKPFCTVKNQLEQLGLSSAYHTLNNEKYGEESIPTFYLYRHKDKSYHIDYGFISKLKKCSYEIGEFDKWIKLSDHIPITLNFVE